MLVLVAACNTQAEEERIRREAEVEARRMEVESTMRVIDEAVFQYRVMRDRKDYLEMCMRAGIVAEGYLSLRDVGKYNEWKAIERFDCKKVGFTIE